MYLHSGLQYMWMWLYVFDSVLKIDFKIQRKTAKDHTTTCVFRHDNSAVNLIALLNKITFLKGQHAI